MQQTGLAHISASSAADKPQALWIQEKELSSSNEILG